MAENSSETKAPVPTLGIDELRVRIEANDAFLLDVRRSTHGGQIYGAIRYDPHKLLAAPRLVLPLPKDGTPVVLYDEDGESKTLAGLSEKLRDEGYAGVHTLAGGFAAWKAADGKMEEATLEQPVPMVSEHQIER
jgi:rhodanese-related sulfurtransferase